MDALITSLMGAVVIVVVSLLARLFSQQRNHK